MSNFIAVQIQNSLQTVISTLKQVTFAGCLLFSSLPSQMPFKYRISNRVFQLMSVRGWQGSGVWERKEQKCRMVGDKFRNIKNNSRNQQFGQLSLIQRTKKRKILELCLMYKGVFQPGLHL